jgi:hypothetical protein
MMMRPASAFGIGGISLVMKVEREDFIVAKISAQNIVGITIVAFAQSIQKPEARRNKCVVMRGEMKPQSRRENGHCFTPFPGRNPGINRRRNDENCDDDEKENFHGDLLNVRCTIAKCDYGLR